MFELIKAMPHHAKNPQILNFKELQIIKKNEQCLPRLLLLTAMFLFMTTSVTKATPSTIMWIPSVDFQGFKSWHLGFDNYIRMQKVNGVRGAGIFDMGVTTGISSFKNV